MAYVDLAALRARIVAEVTRIAQEAGIESPLVAVRVEAPERRGRPFVVQVREDVTTEHAEAMQGRKWQGN